MFVLYFDKWRLQNWVSHGMESKRFAITGARGCIKTIGIFCLALLLLFLPRESHATARPNVLFILIDDMGYADLSCYGEKRIQTPHLDQLAHEGIRFTQFYVAAPICSPSRTGFLAV